LFEVADRAIHFRGRIEKYDPLAAGECFFFTSEGMDLPVRKFLGGGTFELNRELMRVERMTRRDEMNVISQHGAGVDCESRAFGILSETPCDGFNLGPRELHGGALESRLSGESLPMVVWTMRDGTGFGGFGGRAVAKEFPRTDERRP
jgi:hypothetical protein